MAERETSWTLIDAARRGDGGARDEFARRYLGAVRAYLEARWRASTLAADVDDATQEVFVDCFGEHGALERSDPSRPFRPFLYGVARNVAARHERRRGVRRETPVGAAEAEVLEAEETRLSLVFDRAFAAHVMREAAALQRERSKELGGTRARRVELLELRFHQGLSIAAIAQRWSEDNKRVHHIYEDALDDFRDALRDVIARRVGCPPADLERECGWMLELIGG